MEEAPFSFTVKVNGSLLTVRGEDAAAFQTNIQELLNKDSQLPALIKQLHTATNGGTNNA